MNMAGAANSGRDRRKSGINFTRAGIDPASRYSGLNNTLKNSPNRAVAISVKINGRKTHSCKVMGLRRLSIMMSAHISARPTARLVDGGMNHPGRRQSDLATTSG
jgi:hypothetical protein